MARLRVGWGCARRLREAVPVSERDHLRAVLQMELLEDVAHVELHRGVGDQSQARLLARGEGGFVALWSAGREVPDDLAGQPAREWRLAAIERLEELEEVARGRALHQVAVRTAADRFEQVGVGFGHRQDDDLDLW